MSARKRKRAVLAGRLNPKTQRAVLFANDGVAVSMVGARRQLKGILSVTFAGQEMLRAKGQ